MSMRELFEEGPPCSARVVDGCLRMATAGVAWGLLAGSHDSVKEGHRGPSRVVYVAKAVGRNSFLWGCVAGTYLGVNCGIERLRRKRDWVNATVAGAFTGAAMAARTGSGLKILASSVALSAVTTAAHYLSPMQYPPTGV